MIKKKEKKINKKNKKEKSETSKPTTPTVWNPLDIIDAMDRWIWEDPWVPMRLRRWGPMVPRDNWFDRWMETDTKQTAIDIIDNGKEYKVIAEMPGVSKGDIEVSITYNNISICGEKKEEVEEKDEGYIRRERSYSTLCRSMPFPQEVNPDKAEAKLKDGILEIIVAKKTPTKGRNIPVK